MALTNLNILDNLEVSTLIDWNDVSRVMRLTNGACEFMRDIEELNVDIPMASKAINDRTYRQTYIGDDELVAEIANTAIVAGNLVVDLQPVGGSPVEFFRVNSVMFSMNESIQGRVVSGVPGQVTIAPHAGSTIAQLFANFQIGENVNYLGLSTPDRNSSGVDPIKYFPEVQSNYLMHTRDGDAWNRVDNQNARIEYNGGFWQGGMINRTLERMLKAIERKWMWGQAHADFASDRFENGGIDWAIRNRGGVVSGFAAAPTEAQFQFFLDRVTDRKPGIVQRRKKMYMGRKLYKHIVGNFTAGFISEVDPLAPRSGSINSNPRLYMVGGHEVELIFNLAMFQDPQWNNVLTSGAGMTGMKKEWYCYYIDQDPIQIEGSGTVPSIEKIHHSVSPWFAAFGKGIGDQPVGMPIVSGATISPESFGVPMSMIDRSEVQFMYHGGINMATGQYSGVFYPTI